jgi:hypothetical protein
VATGCFSAWLAWFTRTVHRAALCVVEPTARSDFTNSRSTGPPAGARRATLNHQVPSPKH